MPAPNSSIHPEFLQRRQPLPPHDETARVHFHGRLGERKIAGAQARFDRRAQKFAHEIFHGAFEFAKGDVGIDGQPLDLVEHVGVRGVGIIAAVDFARAR